jgi:dynein heavy chain
LDDEDIVTTLDASKITAETVGERMKQAAITNKIIKQTFDDYKPVAERGKDIYFVIADLAAIDPMYQYSLEFFVKLFKMRLASTEKSDDVKERCKILRRDLTSGFYENICRGLFEKHKILFAFLIAMKIDRNEGRVSTREWNYFLRGSDKLTDEELKGRPDWVLEKVWMELVGLERVDTNFQGFK